MIIDVYDRNDDLMLQLDSDNIDGPTFRNDTFHAYLETNASTFDFEIPRFLNGEPIDEVERIDDTCRFGFDENGTYHKFYSYSFTKNFTTITVQCNNLSLEVLTEVNKKFINTKSLTLADYIKNLIFAKGSTGKIGVNEIASRKRTITFEEEETKLARLQTLASKFDAEIEVESNKDGSLVINIYDANTDTGRGTYRHDVILTEDDFVDFEYTADKSEIFNAVHFTGTKKSGDKDVVFDLTNQEKTVKNDDGNIEFYTKKGDPSVFAPLSVSKYSHKIGGTDDWIVMQGATEYTTEADLLAYSFRYTKEHAYPVYTFTLTVAYTSKVNSLKIGDNIDIDISAFFKTEGLWTVRISEIEKRLSVAGTITITAKTAIRRDSEINSTLTKRMQAIADANAPYVLNLTSTESLLFKTQDQKSTINAELVKNNKKISEAVFKWFVNGEQMGQDDTFTVAPNQFEGYALIKCEAYIDDSLVAINTTSAAEVKDGTEGKTSYLHFAYGNSPDGYLDFSTSNSFGRRYIGVLSDFNEDPSQNAADYEWMDTYAKIKATGRNLLLNSNAQIYSASNILLWTLSKEGLTLTNRDPVWLSFDWEYQGEAEAPQFSINRVVYYANGASQEWKNLLWNNDGGKIDASTKSGHFSEAIKWLDWPADVSGINKVEFFLENLGTEGTFGVWDAKLEIGITASGYSRAPEDVDDDIASRASDDDLKTLQEAQSLAEAELRAKASLADMQELIDKLNSIEENAAIEKAEAEANLAAIAGRLEANVNALGELKESWSFIDKYMSASEEGFLISEKDGSSSLLLNDERISMFQNGIEVMHISDSVLHIANGIFTDSMRVGRYRTEQHYSNPDVNVIRYIGGD